MQRPGWGLSAADWLRLRALLLLRRVGHCGINGYETNEQIVHATSKTVLGPWERHGPVQPFGSSAVCPHAARARTASG